MEDEVHDPPKPEMPYRVLWPTGANFHALGQGGEIEEKVPVSWGLKTGDVIRWELARYGGRLSVVRCGNPAGDQVECVFAQVFDEGDLDGA